MLTDEDKEFLINFKKGNPNWDYIGIPNIKDLPAIRWKLYNLNLMNWQKRNAAIKKLEMILKKLDSL